LSGEAKASAPAEEQDSSVVGSNDKDGSKKIRRVKPLAAREQPPLFLLRLKIRK
jgi:hypothetical protein